MERIRVVHVIQDLVPAGAQVMCADLLQNLDSNAFEPSVVLLYDRVGSRLEASLDVARIPIHTIGKRVGPDSHTFIGLDRAFRRLRPHLVHTHIHPLGYALPSMTLRRLGGVHTVHNLAEHEVPTPLQSVHELAFRMGVYPVAPSRAVARSVATTYRRVISVIPNGIDCHRVGVAAGDRLRMRAELALDARDVAVVSVARLDPSKGPLGLIDAMRIVDSHCHVQLLLVGDGPERSKLGARIRRGGLEGRVRMLGSRDDIPSLLAAADVFVLNSKFEGLPLAALEAMAAGLPVVATKVGGLPEVVLPNVTGLLVDPGDWRGLAAAIESLASDAERRRTLGRGAAAFVRRHHDVQSMTRAYASLYARLAAAQAR